LTAFSASLHDALSSLLVRRWESLLRASQVRGTKSALGMFPRVCERIVKVSRDGSVCGAIVRNISAAQRGGPPTG